MTIRPREALLTIGRLSKQSGVPVKTIRFYSDEGLLPPAAVTDAGYRLYGHRERLQLETIRALRGVDVPLARIRELLRGAASARELLALHEQAISLELRRLTRLRSVLRHARETGDDGELRLLRRLNALAAVTASERENQLRAPLDEHFEDREINRDFHEAVVQRLFSGVPDELDESQWDALCELVALLSDPEFGDRLAAQSEAFWQKTPQFETHQWLTECGALVYEASHLVAQEASTGDPFSIELADRLLRAWARACHCAPSASLAAELVNQVREQGPASARIWALSARLRGEDVSLVEEGYRFLFDSLVGWLEAR